MGRMGTSQKLMANYMWAWGEDTVYCKKNKYIYILYIGFAKNFWMLEWDSPHPAGAQVVGFFWGETQFYSQLCIL